MRNFYQPKIAIIKRIEKQTPEVKLFTLVFKNRKDQKSFQFIPGQFIEVGLPGFGEAPFAVCSDPNLTEKSFQICVRRVGSLTSKIDKLKIGDFLTFRGPYGNGFVDLEDKNLLLIAGGIGIIPLRSIILSFLNSKTKKIQMFYGVSELEDILFKKEFKIWKKFIDLQITLDKKCPGWKGHTGLITTLFDKVRIINKTIAIVCGPLIMYKSVIKKLKEKGFSDSDIYLSLERRIHCGIGVCQHCAIGSKYVCKDGPIFSYKELKNIKGGI